ATGRMVASGTLLTHFTPEVFVHPELLTNASQAALTGDEAVAARELDLRLQLYVGSNGFRHGADDPNIKWLRGKTNEFGNSWYFIDRQGDFFAWDGKPGSHGKLLHDFQPQLFLDPQLLYEAPPVPLAGPEANQARQFDETLGLFVDASGFFPNVQGKD